MKILGERLQSLRTGTQAEIAKKFGISSQAYSRWEIGDRNPDPEELVKLADYYSVSVDWLLGREGAAKEISPRLALPAECPQCRVKDELLLSQSRSIENLTL